ncbi:protein of unknown function [Candidatus Nitrospira inopinata]|uniref:Uncharacterized protein n=1 Tax=Candidatus Nitrospira inopinata TaxID=1715989 RepID=A0A0S4KTN0_9BACT|nr:protein of unknown function [Candidatus Nitrospira inopinata]
MYQALVRRVNRGVGDVKTVGNGREWGLSEIVQHGREEPFEPLIRGDATRHGIGLSRGWGLGVDVAAARQIPMQRGQFDLQVFERLGLRQDVGVVFQMAVPAAFFFPHDVFGRVHRGQYSGHR